MPSYAELAVQMRQCHEHRQELHHTHTPFRFVSPNRYSSLRVRMVIQRRYIIMFCIGHTNVYMLIDHPMKTKAIVEMFACINEIVQCNYLIEVENACCFLDHTETNLYKYRDKNMNMNTQLCRHTYNIYIIYAFSEN